jgi:hypothetical protein
MKLMPLTTTCPFDNTGGLKDALGRRKFLKMRLGLQLKFNKMSQQL